MHRTTFSSALLILSLELCIFSLFADQISSPPESSQILQEAEQAFAKRNFAEAFPKFEQAIKLLEQQNDRKSIADASFKLGVTCIELGKYSEGQQAFSRALKLHEELGDKSAVGMDLTRLAGIEFNQGNYKKSLELSRKALDIHEAVGNQKGIADTLRLIGVVNEFQDNYDEALKYVGQAIEIFTAINDTEGIAKCYSNIGGVYWKQGKLDEAMEKFKKSLAIAESDKREDLMAKTLGNMGLIYWNQGDTEKAFESYEKSQVIAREIGARQTESLNFFNLAILHQENGNYKQSQDSYQNALEIARELGDKGLEGVCLEGLGKLFKIFGDYDIALEYFDRSLKIAQEIGEQRAAAFSIKSIGEVHEIRENHKVAIEYFQRARQMYEQMGEKRGIGIALEKIGQLRWKSGKYDLALNDFMESLRIFESIGARAEMPGTYMMIGLAHRSKKEFPEAQAAFSKSIEIAKETGKVDQLWQSLHNKGEMLRDLGKNDEALQLMVESIAVLERMRGEVNLAEQRAGYFEDKVKVYNDSIQLLISKQNLPEAFEYVQQSKARSFLDMLAEARVNQESILDSELRDRKKKNETKLSKIQQNIQSEYEKEVVDRSKIQEFEKKRNELELEYANLILEIRKQNPRYADVQYPHPLKLLEAQTFLDRESILLEYSIGETASWLFAVTSDSLAVFELPGEKKLTEQVHQIREVLVKSDPTFETLEHSYSKYEKLAQTLYEELIKPAQSILQGKQRILIAPDGALSYLPFESLLTSTRQTGAFDFKKLPYLAREYEIYYVPSISVLASVLKNDQKKNVERKQLLAFADPQLSNSADPTKKVEVAKVRSWVGTLAPLPHARAEVEKIASLYPKDEVTVFEGREASEKNLKQTNLQEYRKVHFASHGIIDEEKPEFSALILSGDEKGGEDGYLTMREVFDLKLNADLVVLSACKTGLGKEISGEGVTGISRAFLCAGTPSVLVSLWDVYDRSTADFMAGFYKNMEVKGMNKAAALRQARLELIASKKFSHPYYWAAFILVGSQ